MCYNKTQRRRALLRLAAVYRNVALPYGGAFLVLGKRYQNRIIIRGYIMARLIGSAGSDNYGERLFIQKAAEYLDDTNIIYRNRQLFGREFDVCILMPGKGILVIELKGWREENILRIENNESVVIRTDDGEVYASPQKQVRGYRFSIERYIRQNIGKFPLVYHMVCLPQVTKEFFKAKRLDVVMEERFTLLCDDLADNAAFFDKLNLALREVSHWRRDPFDRRTVLEVRNLFETDVDTDYEDESDIKAESELCSARHDYSRFYYFGGDDMPSEDTVDDITAEYMKGCKLYCVFSYRAQMLRILESLDAALTQKGLVRNRDNIEISFEEDRGHEPTLSTVADSFMSFHSAMSVLREPFDGSSFMIKNGNCTPEQKQILGKLSAQSGFNLEQYEAEHADTGKNIVIRAGAGTGKTYTMISRIAYVCYTQNTPLRRMADRLVMITFTNEAADQMAEKLKIYFKNCYLITSDPKYQEMVSRIDRMQISTIHSYAKTLIARMGICFGYGVDMSITSGQYSRRKKISDILDSYVMQKETEYGKSYTDRLGMPVYAIRESILDFIGKLHNKSVDISSIQPEDFGAVADDGSNKELHELLAWVIPAVEREYAAELLADNRIHLGSMMSVLNRFINDPESESRIRELKRDDNVGQFMFVDEFQDTDDSQIDSLLRISEILDYRLFLVGDIKQCIYRFRGAKEKAFDRLGIKKEPKKWLELSLRRNYRTDKHLLDIFGASFTAWAERGDELLVYDAAKDSLIGTRDYNGNYLSDKTRFYRCLRSADEASRINELVKEIERTQRRIAYEESHGMKLSAKEKSIAILVRENWQADLVRTECAKQGIVVRTNTGGDLYMSQPAIDMLVLLNALVHFDEADYLYSLVISNFFDLDIPRSNLYEIRKRMRSGGWRAKSDEREQVNYLIKYMNSALTDKCRWENTVASLRTQPVLQVIRKIYDVLEPWKHFSTDSYKQHYYQLNVDLLFEQVINSCNIDRLTVNTLREHLYNNIVSQTSVDSRTPAKTEDDVTISCITVHKSKGLEYGHVIMPFCSASIDHIKRSQLHISTAKQQDKCRIGYSMSTGGLKNSFYDESTERSEKAREEVRVLYVALTRAIRSFSWIEVEGKQNLSWQNLIAKEV